MLRLRHLIALLLLISTGCLKPAGIRYPGLPEADDGALHIINFDVGQADALLVIYRGKSLLIDCGSPLTSPLRASHRIPRRLDALLGKRHIDYFLITHYHQDHIGAPGRQRNQRHPSGIYSLIERDGVTIGTILDRGFWTVGKKGATQKKYEAAIQHWISSGVVERRRAMHPGDTIEMGRGMTLEVVTASSNGVLDRLNAMYPTFLTENPASENDYSIGLKLTLGDFEMFTAGDLSGYNLVRHFGPKTQSYNDIETRIAAQVGPVEVYRVNHHGSRNSTNPCFAEVLRPAVSIISTGKNTYGHPDIDVYRRLKSFGDVRITGGADDQVIDLIRDDIVGNDVEVLVDPEGKLYWVNGKAYTALSEEEERARPAQRLTCDESPDAAPDTYENLAGGSHD